MLSLSMSTCKDNTAFCDFGSFAIAFFIALRYFVSEAVSVGTPKSGSLNLYCCASFCMFLNVASYTFCVSFNAFVFPSFFAKSSYSLFTCFSVLTISCNMPRRGSVFVPPDAFGFFGVFGVSFSGITYFCSVFLSSVNNRTNFSSSSNFLPNCICADHPKKPPCAIATLIL